MTFDNYTTKRSVVIKNTLNPVWNETLLLDNVKLYGDTGRRGYIDKLQDIDCVTVQIWDDDGSLVSVKRLC